MPAFKDKTGMVFGEWSVLFRGANAGKNTRWMCRCSCGRRFLVRTESLRSKKSERCEPCRRVRSANSDYFRTHGQSHIPEYRIWCGMRQRCSDPKEKCFSNYGGRGIRVCERWASPQGFPFFLKDMGLRPSTKHSLERVENDGNYSPENCIWATRAVQALNRRNNLLITIQDETLPLKVWCTRYHTSYHRTKRRIYAGWSPEAALTEPPMQLRRSRAWMANSEVSR